MNAWHESDLRCRELFDLMEQATWTDDLVLLSFWQCLAAQAGSLPRVELSLYLRQDERVVQRFSSDLQCLFSQGLQLCPAWQ